MSTESRRRGQQDRKAAWAERCRRWSEVHDVRERDAAGRAVLRWGLYDAQERPRGVAGAARATDLLWDRAGIPAGWTVRKLAEVQYRALVARGVPVVEGRG